MSENSNVSGKKTSAKIIDNITDTRPQKSVSDCQLPTWKILFGEALIKYGIRLMKEPFLPLTPEDVKDFHSIQHEMLAVNGLAISTTGTNPVMTSTGGENTSNEPSMPTNASHPAKTINTSGEPNQATENQSPAPGVEATSTPVICSIEADGWMPISIPGNLTESERLEFVTGFRLISMHLAWAEYLDNVGVLLNNYQAFVDQYVPLLRSILAAKGSPMYKPGVKRNSTESQVSDGISPPKPHRTSSLAQPQPDILDPQANKMKVNQLIGKEGNLSSSAEGNKKGGLNDVSAANSSNTSNEAHSRATSATPQPSKLTDDTARHLFNLSTSGSNKLNADDQISKETGSNGPVETIKKAQNHGAVYPPLSPTTSSHTSNLFLSITNDTEALFIAPFREPCKPGYLLQASKLFNPSTKPAKNSTNMFYFKGSNTGSITKVPTPLNSFTKKARTASITANGQAAVSAPGGLPEGAKIGSLNGISAASTSSTSVPANTAFLPASSGSSVASANFQVPRFGSVSGPSSLSQFAQNASKNQAKVEKEAKAKRKAEEFDSEEEEDEALERKDAEMERAKRSKIVEAAKLTPGFKVQATNSPATISPAISSTAPNSAVLSKPESTESSSPSMLQNQQSTSSVSDALGKKQSPNILGNIANQGPVATASTTDELADYESDGNQPKMPTTQKSTSSASSSTGHGQSNNILRSSQLVASQALSAGPTNPSIRGGGAEPQAHSVHPSSSSPSGSDTEQEEKPSRYSMRLRRQRLQRRSAELRGSRLHRR
jgi:hypothetical protein